MLSSSILTKDLSIDADQITVDGEKQQLTIPGNVSIRFSNAIVKTENMIFI